MDEQNKQKITPMEAAKSLLERDENGEYKIGSFNGPEERKNLTEVVRILSQVDLDAQNPEEWKGLKKALGIVGAYDQYAWSKHENITVHQLPDLVKSGSLDLARLYVSQFFGDRIARPFYENDTIMKAWVKTSDEIIGRESTTVSMSDLGKAAVKSGVREGEVEAGKAKEENTRENSDKTPDEK